MHLNSVMPSLPVSDLHAAISFYTEKLGFKLSFQNGDLFAIVRRDGIEIGLMPESVHHVPPGSGRLYLKVTDIEAWYEHILSHDLTVLHPLKAESYGMYEFQIADPDGNHINYGEPTDSNDPPAIDE